MKYDSQSKGSQQELSEVHSCRHRQIQEPGSDECLHEQEKKYTRLLEELKSIDRVIRPGFIVGGPFQTLQNNGIVPMSLTQLNRDNLPSTGCDIAQTMEEALSSELETTLLTDDEIRFGSDLTMEQVLQKQIMPSALEIDECFTKTGTHQAKPIQGVFSWQEEDVSFSTMKKLVQTRLCFKFESGGGTYLQSNNLRNNLGEPSSSLFECDSTAANDSAGSILFRRNGSWAPGFRWQQVEMPATWDSIMVESVRLVLQRWRGVCSFSQTMRGTWIEDDDVSELHPKKQRRPFNPTSVRRRE